MVQEQMFLSISYWLVETINRQRLNWMLTFRIGHKRLSKQYAQISIRFHGLRGPTSLDLPLDLAVDRLRFHLTIGELERSIPDY
jgi:hypothetical protein